MIHRAHSSPSHKPPLAAKLTKALNKVLDNLEEYTANAERLARRIYEENGIQGAAEVVEGEAALAATRG